MRKPGLLLLQLLMPLVALAAATETLPLDGKWKFFCSEGMNSGKWSTINVPSQWELEGFGDYTYGRFYTKDKNAEPAKETGIYRRDVTVPASWRGKKVEIVFDGVMTDAEVFVNGVAAGPVHQGGFYVFAHDISDKVKYGRKNSIEVRVAKHSANNSVNRAERRADWWLFGGIYRSVRLTAKPPRHIERLRVDARADGTLRLGVHSRNSSGCKVRLSIGDDTREMPLATEDTVLECRWDGIKPWDPEHPNLYTLTAELIDAEGNVCHSTSERIGFRTIDFRPGDGIYLNGVKLRVKGINRHCFTPAKGRTPDQAQNREDVRLIKQMNINAVRSHYSPDRGFLNLCDSIGLLYFDELCGWHGSYDTKTGLRLLHEQMASDQNHPCIFMWGNGNEGGWNKKLDARFAELDLQQRHVAHPWQDFNDIDTHHYPSFYTGPGKFAAGEHVFMPTEFMHSMYDQGGGAGLEDMWEGFSKSPLFAGGFIWAFCDEAVVRSDRGGILDSDGSNAPDGVVGPHREKEGSFYAIRDIWSPVQIAPLRITDSFDGSIFVTNGFLFSKLDECQLRFSVGDGMHSVLLPAAEPGETVKVRLPLPEGWRAKDVLSVEVLGHGGDVINTWTWPIHTPAYYLEKISAGEGTARTAAPDALEAAGVRVSFSEGLISEITADGRRIPLANGPVPVGLKATFKSGAFRMEGPEAVYVARYDGDVDSIEWRMRPNGSLIMEAVMCNKTKPSDNKVTALGLTFDYPEEDVIGMEWTGRGPYRMWKNRQRGQQMGTWCKTYNNTVTGEGPGMLAYPEFKGYHGNLYSATLLSRSGDFTVHCGTENIFLRMLTPEEPEGRADGKATMPAFPPGDISFLYEIPAIASFRPTEEQGPMSHPARIRYNRGDDGLHLKLLFQFK